LGTKLREERKRAALPAEFFVKPSAHCGSLYRGRVVKPDLTYDERECCIVENSMIA
jgi:hypothetical protein